MARDLHICSFATVWCDRVPRLCGLVSLTDRLQKAMEEHCNDEWLENLDRDPFAFVRKVLLKPVAARDRLQTGMEGLHSVAPMSAIVCGLGATWLARRCEGVGGLCRFRFTAAHDYMPRLCGLFSLNYRLQGAMKEHNSGWLKNMHRCQKFVELLKSHQVADAKYWSLVAFFVFQLDGQDCVAGLTGSVA